MSKDFDGAAMDASAVEAAKDLPGLKTAEDVARWYAKWIVGAGYKRLSRALLNYFHVEIEKP